MEATNSGDLHTVCNHGRTTGRQHHGQRRRGSVDASQSTTIQGGTLNNNGGAFFGTPLDSTAYLDGSTAAGAVTLNGTYTTDYNSNDLSFRHHQQSGQNQGNFQLNGGGGDNTYLYTIGNVTLQGGGTVTLNTTTAAAGAMPGSTRPA